MKIAISLLAVDQCSILIRVVLAAIILLASTACRSARIPEAPPQQVAIEQLPEALHGYWIQSEVFRTLKNPWAGKIPLPLPETYASDVTGTHLTLRDGKRRAVIDVHIVTSETGMEARFRLADDRETAYHIMKRAAEDHMILLFRAYSNDAIQNVIPLRIAHGPPLVPVGYETRLSQVTPINTMSKLEKPAL